MKNRRAPGSLDNVEAEFCVFPDNLSGGIEADRSAGTEGYVGVLSIEDRCRGGESVLEMTGEDQPSPGILVFQAMLAVSLQVVGIPSAWECPWPSGPRNWGQSAFSDDEMEKITKRAGRLLRMVVLILEGRVFRRSVGVESDSISDQRKSRARRIEFV